MRIGFARALAVAWLAGAAVLAAPAAADSVHTLGFQAGTQSFWGPGGTAAAFDAGGEAAIQIGAIRAGVGFDVAASTGTVRGGYGGSLSFAFADTVGTGLLGIPVSFGGGAASFNTSFGASMDVFGFATGDTGFPFGVIDIHISAPPFPLGNTLQTSRSPVTTGLGSAATWSGATNFDIPAVSVPLIAEFGPTFKVTQGSSFTPTGIDGTMVYTHRETGTRYETAFSVGGVPVVDLGLEGWWDFSIEDLTLRNTFRTGFDGAIGGYVDVIILGRHELTSPNFNLFDVSAFGLTFGQLGVNQAFSIFVTDAQAPVPEPGTLVLVAMVAGAAVWRKRRRCP
jgi:hypothetical protein